jgi:metal-sulfur cluster biosynthetic enzyme
MMVIDGKEEIESIIDPGSQIVAMSEKVCHNLGQIYDPDIRVNMQ